MHHLVLPRLSARADLRRQAIKLRFWQQNDTRVADLNWIRMPGETLFILELADGYGLADGFRIVFCEVPNPEPDGTICVLAVMRADEPMTTTAHEVLRGRERIARERLSAVPYPEL
jgi:hypothetical protein